MNGVKRKIKGKEFVRDLRNGMADRELMEKYALSAGQLRSVFRKLLDSGAIGEMDLYTRTTVSESTITRASAMSRTAGQGLEQRGSSVTWSRETPTAEVAEKDWLKFCLPSCLQWGELIFKTFCCSAKFSRANIPDKDCSRNNMRSIFVSALPSLR